MQVAATTSGRASQMPATQTAKDGSLTEETPGQGSHGLGPDSSTNPERIGTLSRVLTFPSLSLAA